MTRSIESISVDQHEDLLAGLIDVCNAEVE